MGTSVSGLCAQQGDLKKAKTILAALQSPLAVYMLLAKYLGTASANFDSKFTESKNNQVTGTCNV